jgi:hypothetical protein
MGDLKFQNLQTKYENFWKMNTIQRFIFHTWLNNKRLLNHFLSLKTCFLNVRTKLHPSFLLLNFWYFTGLQSPQNTLSNTHNGKSHTKQPFVTATLTTLIHNKLTHRYLAACNCIISSWRSTRLAREILTRASYKNASESSTNVALISN